MLTGRRALITALAGLFISGAIPARAQQAESRRADQVIAEIERLMEREPTSYAKILDALNQALPAMAGFPDKRAKIDSYIVDWTGKRAAAEIKQRNTALIEGLEKDLEDPAKIPSVREKLDAAARAAFTLGKDWQRRVTNIRFRVLQETLKPIDQHKEAGRLEQAIVVCDAALVAFNQEFDRAGGTASAQVLSLYKELIARSDALVEAVETPELEAKVKARDLLSPEERDLWNLSGTATLTPARKSIVIEGSDSGRGGVVSLLPPRDRPWNDLVIDLEFTLKAGDMDMYLRYWPDKKSYLIRFAQSQGYELDKTYRMTIRVKGSTVSLKASDQPENIDRFAIDTSRTGGIGLGVRTGAKVVVSRFDLKVLR